MPFSTNAGTEKGLGPDHKAVAALSKVQSTETPSPHKPPHNFPCAAPSIARQRASLTETPIDLSAPLDTSLSSDPEKPQTVLYLAYGSNLAARTFLGQRGIRPLSQVNVVVPELVMTFDLAGLPYTEPCFANTAYRTLDKPTPAPSSPPPAYSEKSSLLPAASKPPKYTNPHWPKGLVGVVYEVTQTDFAHIIATEGGGASYQDILISCHALPPSATEVPLHPTSPSFKAHTLFSPVSPPGTPPGGRLSRPDPEYAQASARYLKLITDGADEHGIPEEYKAYLRALQPYTITTNGQRLGRFVFMLVWYPLIIALFTLGRLFHDKDGRSPPWMVRITGAVFRGVWISYDGFFRGLFGDGERTIEGEEEGAGRARRPRKLVKKRRNWALGEKGRRLVDGV
ncbi:hypothetical protein G7Y79_00011g030950 [Physcia stellaris]|nr:hypothetical protein G7Y79_00011g030950 [Physcia stellaris]